MEIWGEDKKHPAQIAAKLKCAGCLQASPKGLPCLYYTTKGRAGIQELFLCHKKELKERKGKSVWVSL